MRKRIVALFLIVAMVLSVSACGSKTADNKTSDVELLSEKMGGEQATPDTQASEAEDGSLYPLVNEYITIEGLVIDGDTSVSKECVIWNIL